VAPPRLKDHRNVTHTHDDAPLRRKVDASFHSGACASRDQ
jgi:hypothetical protein